MTSKDPVGSKPWILRFGHPLSQEPAGSSTTPADELPQTLMTRIDAETTDNE
jgi:hypothetical protein